MKPVHHTTTMNQTVNVHIDRIRFTAPCIHKPTGKILYFDESELDELIPSGATANQKVIKDGGEKAYVRSKQIEASTGKATLMEVHCCPPMVLQKHNLFGHADLVRYVYEIMDLLTKRLEIRVESFDRQEWLRGGVSITEVHLTANFACPRDDVLPIIQAIDESNLDSKQRIIPSCITLGYSPKRRSTFDMLTVYDKMLELMNRWKKPGRYQSKLIAEAAKGIRVEVKLYSQGLKHRELQYASRWKAADVASLFFEYLEKYKIQHTIQRLLTEDELRMLSKSERKAYQMWLLGMPIRDQFGRTTAWKYAEAIYEKTRIDVRSERRPEALPAIDTSTIFVPKNVLPVPAWALNTEYYFAPERTRLRPPGIEWIPTDWNDADEVIGS